MLEIPVLVTSAWTLLQPLLPVIAAKGAEEVGQLAVGEVWGAIKKKFDGEAHTQKVLLKLLKDPQNSDVQAAFRVALQDILEEDPSFVQQFSNLLESAGSDTKGQVIGGGALAQGNHAKAVGQNGMLIEGNVTGNITVGNNNRINDNR